MNTSTYRPPHNYEEHLLWQWMSALLAYMEETIRLDEEAQPRCKCCGATENLTSGYSGGNLIWKCPGAAYEANHPGM